jgi:anti-sigma-K factor RskA
MNKNETFPDIILERYILGELHRDQMEYIRRTLACDTDLNERVEKLIKSNEAILKEHPASEMADAINLRLHSNRVGTQSEGKKNSWFDMPFQSPLFASLAIAVVIVSLTSLVRQNRIHYAIHNEIRVKGLQPHLVVFKKNRADQRVEMLHNLSSASQGDILQLGYVAVDKKYGTIISLDGRGTVTQHFPETVDGSTLLVKGKDVLLSRAYELDNAPQFERFFFITSDNPIDISTVRKSIEKMVQKHNKSLETETLDLPAGFQQFYLVIRKVAL